MFLVLHHAWIVPIWFIAPVGAVMAAVGGAAVGAAYVELEPGLPRRPWRSAAVAMTFGGILLPAVVIAQVVGPVFAMASDGGGTLLIPESELFVVVLVGLIGVTAVAGAAVGFLVGRTRRAAALTMLAGVALAIGPGHNIPLLGGSAVVPKELAILAVVIAVASVVLVTLDAELSRRRTPRLRVSRPE